MGVETHMLVVTVKAAYNGSAQAKPSPTRCPPSAVYAR